MNKVAIVADLHLEGLRNILPGNSVPLQLEALRRVLLSMQSLGIRDLIVAGDLFDHAHPQEETQQALGDLIIAHPQIHWHIKPGNHDRPLLDQHSMKMFHWLQRRGLVKNCTIYLTPVLASIGGLTLWMCPHPFIEPPPPEADYAIGHFAWTGARRDNGSAHATGHTPAGQWVLGDFHRPQAGARFHYVGSLTQVEWSETGARGYSILYRDRRDGAMRLTRRRIEAPYLLDVLPVADLNALDWLADYREEKHRWWKVLVEVGVQLPADWQREFPQVVARGVLGKAAPTAAVPAQVQLSEDPFEGLRDLLEERGNLLPEQVEWAVARARALRGELEKQG